MPTSLCYVVSFLCICSFGYSNVDFRTCEPSLCKGTMKLKNECTHIRKLYSAALQRKETRTICRKDACRKAVLRATISLGAALTAGPRRLILYGDSLSRQLYESLLCLFEEPSSEFSELLKQLRPKDLLVANFGDWWNENYKDLQAKCALFGHMRNIWVSLVYMKVG
ncbi:hypothetical protein CYMTET_52751 [Cymbomonas tetramitiformis]|uniref:Uncharacterized protein n=1 Tax=Cymbomonas tetramitiformis TaxID=36881 RepID=A0AAE0BK49_9CHLO|nr:hypothetical protein CYMTET_52751 [Cymbomonas tetramitiformis]